MPFDDELPTDSLPELFDSISLPENILTESEGKKFNRSTKTDVIPF